ncbi:MAG: hypothetical protein II480_04220 [Bacteroidales bacterium]|nr:hypothetical protein [Bacteroidales bacterium]
MDNLYPLTDTQFAVYTYCMTHPKDAVYQICMTFGAYRSIDARRLKSATESAINNHPIMKVRIVNDSLGQPAMQRNDNEPPVVDILDDLQQFQTSVSIHGRLYNVAIIDDARGCQLAVCVHHLISDGYSMNVFVHEISEAYLATNCSPNNAVFLMLQPTKFH